MIELLKRTVTRIILSKKKEMDAVNQEEESEEKMEDLPSKLEDLEDIDD